MATVAERIYVVAGAKNSMMGGLIPICETFETREALAEFIVANPQEKDEVEYKVLKVYADADTGHYNDQLNLILGAEEIFPYTYVTVGYKGE